MDNLFFISGIAFIIMHEMDAVRCREWRIFPGLSALNEKLGFTIFIFAHIPIFIWLFWRTTNGADLASFKVGFDIFLMIHLGLHILFLMHKNNEFKDWISWTIIVGAGLCGLLDLVVG